MRAYGTHSSRVWESKVQGLPLVRTFLCASIARRWSLCGRGGGANILQRGPLPHSSHRRTVSTPMTFLSLSLKFPTHEFQRTLET